MSGGMSNATMDPAKFKSTMTSINQGTVMAAAARNLKKEMLREQTERQVDPSRGVVDMHDLEQDEELEQLHRDRIAQMKREAEKRSAMATKGHGDYQEVGEGDFLPAVTGSSHVVVHFYHCDFERCRIVDKHLSAIAKKYFRTRFVKVHAPDAPFFVTKLGVQVLPCVVMFLEGKAYDRIVGFDEFGTRDDFNTELLEQRLLISGVVAPPERTEEDEDAEEERRRMVTRIRQGGAHDSDDEDSDFE